MGVTVTNLIQGPGDIFGAAFGTAEPADSAVSGPLTAAGWRDLGGTKDGVTLRVSQAVSKLTVDQVVEDVGGVRTRRAVRLATNLAEPTLENLAFALNDTAPVTGAQFDTWEPSTGTAASQMTYYAVCFQGFAPNGKRRWVFIRRTLGVEDVEAPYKKDDQTVFPVTFESHYVSAAVKSVRIVDQK